MMADRRPAAGVALRVGAAALALVLVGCGDDDPSTAASSGAPSTTAAPAPSSSCAGDIVLVASTYGEYEETADVIGLTADGEVRRLTDDGGAFGPSLSPDGSQIAIAAVGPGGEVSDTTGPYKLDIVVMGVDGSERRTVVGGQDARQPDWSPDGERIAYVEQGDPDTGDDAHRIHIVAPDGTSDRVLVAHDGPEDDAAPAWSPDGERLAFVRRDREGTTQQLVVVDADGTGAEVVHETSSWLGAPVWSPDGSRLAVPSLGTDGGAALAVVTLDGGAVVEEPNRVEGLAWAASGRLYGFARSPAGADDSGEWRVTELEPDGEGFATGRAVGAFEPEGYLYTDYEVDVPDCLGPDAAPLTSEADEPEVLVIAHPETGEDVEVITRGQAVALAVDHHDDPEAGAARSSALLVFGDDATQAAVDAVAPWPDPAPAGPAGSGGEPDVRRPSRVDLPDGELAWLVATDGSLTVIEATSGEQLSAGGGPDFVLPDVPDLAP